MTREPGGTALGGSLRQLLLREPGDAAEADGADIAPRAEALISPPTGRSTWLKWSVRRWNAEPW